MMNTLHISGSVLMSVSLTQPRFQWLCKPNDDCCCKDHYYKWIIRYGRQWACNNSYGHAKWLEY